MTARPRGQKRLFSWRKAKKHWVYGLAEIRALYRVSRNTPRNWLREGLKPIDDARPALVLGDQLNAFHRDRWEKARRPVASDEFFCVACRRPRKPQSGSFRLTCAQPGVRIATAPCPECGRPMHRFLARRKGIESAEPMGPDPGCPADTEMRDQPCPHLCNSGLEEG